MLWSHWRRLRCATLGSCGPWRPGRRRRAKSEVEDDGVWFSEIGDGAGFGVAFRVALKADVVFLGECVGFVREE